MSVYFSYSAYSCREYVGSSFRRNTGSYGQDFTASQNKLHRRDNEIYSLLGYKTEQLGKKPAISKEYIASIFIAKQC
jgi:hypothetical protein